MSQFNRVDTTANRLRIAMSEAGKRQTDLVRETGIDKGALSYYLKGRYEPKQETIHKLAKALDVSEMWLWGYECSKARTPEQKNNDVIADIIIRLRSDNEFLSVVESLLSLEDVKLAIIKQTASAFQK